MPGSSRVRTFQIVASVAIGFALGALVQPLVGHAQSNVRVFELRTYAAPEGKLGALNARFRDNTMRIFARHGMTSIGYWTPQDSPGSQNTLIYILAHPDRETARRNWAAFQQDPEWQKVRTETQANGPIVTKVDSVFLQATDYSPIK